MKQYKDTIGGRRFAKVLKDIRENPNSWDQTSWHCGSAHCIAGHGQLRHRKISLKKFEEINVSETPRKYGFLNNSGTISDDAKEYFKLSEADANYLFNSQRTLRNFYKFLLTTKFGYNDGGYDRDGYNKKGFDKNGLTIDGYDKHGVWHPLSYRLR